MKKIQKLTVVLMLALTSLFLLGACQKSANRKTRQHAKTSQTSKEVSKKKSSSTKDQQGSASSQGQAKTAPQAPSQSSSQEQAAPQTQPSSKLDVAAVARGDLSSIAGTYRGQNGAISFTINGDGTGTITKSDGDFSCQFTNYHQEGQTASFSNQYGWIYYLVPAGVETPVGAQAISQWDDSSRDRLIVIGEGVNVFFIN